MRATLSEIFRFPAENAEKNLRRRGFFVSHVARLTHAARNARVTATFENNLAIARSTDDSPAIIRASPTHLAAE